MYLSLDEVKQHINVDKGYLEDDAYILSLMDAAEEAVSINLDIPLQCLADEDNIPSSVKHAMLLLIGNWYRYREGVSIGNGNVLPQSYQYLINLNRKYK